jgi:hypothetical protein
MIECVHAAWCRSVIPGRLVCERYERERIGIHKRGRQSPRVRHWLGGAVVVFVVVKLVQVSKKMIGSQYIVVFVLDWLIGRNHCCNSEQFAWGKVVCRDVKPPKAIEGTYLCGICGSANASPRLVDLCAAAEPAEAIPGPTSGKLFLKAA